MNPTTPRSAGRTCLAAMGALAATAALVLAQWQVNTQVSGRVNNRVGGELYGNMGSVKYASYQTRMLPSEERYAVWRSGALPSEIALNSNAVGPLSPNGVINSIPGPNAVQLAGRAPMPQLYNPAYSLNTRVDQGPLPVVGYGTGTIKYAQSSAATPINAMVSSQRVSGAVPSARVSTGQFTGQVKSTPPTMVAQVNNPPRLDSPDLVERFSSPQSMGSIRYAQPATPSLAPTSQPAPK